MIKKVLTIVIILIGAAGIIFGIYELRQTEAKNSFLASLQKRPLPKAKAVESFKKGSAEDQFLVAQFYLQKKDTHKLEDALTQIIVETETPKFWRVRAFFNLGNLQVEKLLATQGQDQTALKNAISYYEEALRLESDYWPAKYNLERLLIQESSSQSSEGKKEKEANPEPKSKKEEKTPRPDESRPKMNPPPQGQP